jgi:dynactin-4
MIADCRCARNCFSCPRCESSLAVQASEKRAEDGSLESGAPYILACGGCRWTSREVGWEFEKPTGLAGKSSSLIRGTN